MVRAVSTLLVGCLLRRCGGIDLAVVAASSEEGAKSISMVPLRLWTQVGVASNVGSNPLELAGMVGRESDGSPVRDPCDDARHARGTGVGQPPTAVEVTLPSVGAREDSVAQGTEVERVSALDKGAFVSLRSGAGRVLSL